MARRTSLIGRIDGQQLWSGWRTELRRSSRARVFGLRSQHAGRAVRRRVEGRLGVRRPDAPGYRRGIPLSEEGARRRARRSGNGQDRHASPRWQARSRTIRPAAYCRSSASTGSTTDFLKKKMQFNVFFAGVLCLREPHRPVTRRDEGRSGRRGRRSSDIKLDDKIFVSGVEDVSQRVRRRSQYVTGRAGLPARRLLQDRGDRRFRVERLRRQLRGPRRPRGPERRRRNQPVVRASERPRGLRRDATVRVQPQGIFDHRGGNGLVALCSGSGGACTTTTRRHSSIRRSIRTRRSFQTWKLTAVQGVVPPEVPEAEGRDRLPRRERTSTASASTDSAGSATRASRVTREPAYGSIPDTSRAPAGGSTSSTPSASDASAEFGARARTRSRTTGSAITRESGLSFNVVGPWKTIWQGSYGRAIASDVP
mgnify:CR=1 FL=1